MKRNSENGDAQGASRQIRTVASPWRRVCVSKLTQLIGAAIFRATGSWLTQSLLSLLRKLGLLQDLNVQSSKPDVLILFTDLAIGFVAFIEKKLFKGPYSTVLDLDPSWSQLEPKLCCWLDKLFNLFASLLLQQRNTTYHSVCVRIKQQRIATKQMEL